MIAVIETTESSRCDSCTEGDTTRILTLAIGYSAAATAVVRLCHRCIETDLLPGLIARHMDA